MFLEGSSHAVTNDHRHSSLKQHKGITFQVWRLEVQNVLHWAKTKVSTGHIPSGCSRGESVSWLLQASANHPQLLAPGPSSISSGL